MLLIGRRWDTLTIGEALDIVEAILAEGQGVDQTLDAIHDRIALLFPDASSWGQSASAQRGLAAAEAAWGGPAEPEEQPSTVADVPESDVSP